MARPPKRSNNFEKVEIGEFIFGEIEEVQYDNEHKFSFKKEETVCPGVRLKFKLDGYQYPHYSRWMRFNMGSKSNLYKNYIEKLVRAAHPDMDFDLDEFNGFRVKTLWSENGEFQNIDNIFPEVGKLEVTEIQEEALNAALDETQEPSPSDEAPGDPQVEKDLGWGDQTDPGQNKKQDPKKNGKK